MSFIKESNTNCIKINSSNNNNNNNNNNSNNNNNIHDNDHDNTNNDNKILMNIDDVQEKYLRETTLFFRGIDKPLKYGPNVNTLKDLIKSLYDAFETKYVNIELVNHLMLSYKSNPKEWQKFAKWDRFRYTRNLVDEGNGKFNLMILCWGEGHASAIHDHSNSHCFMKIMKGELIETKYEMPSINNNNNNNNKNNQNDNIENSLVCYNNLNDKEDYNRIELKEISRKKLELNGVCYINDNIGLHRVENPSHTDGAVSLHLYCPPFNSCSIFQKNSGKPVKCPVTFWSKYGVKQQSKESESK